MASLKVSTTNTVRASMRGFTLIEILISISILILLMGLGLFMTLDAFRGYTTRSEVDTTVALLTRARSRAMANVSQSPWGVCVSGSSYIVFRGSACTPGVISNEVTPLGAGAVVTGLSGVVFDQLTGDTVASTISITQQGRTSTITLNHEGTIMW